MATLNLAWLSKGTILTRYQTQEFNDGLKQSGQEWYKCLVKTISNIGFKKSSSDVAVFTR